MSYQVLARKWRSRTFAQVMGQEHVVRALTNALKTSRLHHAYLFTGTRGVGKTSLARILAKSLNCETGVQEEPCGQCTACTQIDGGRFVDLLEIDAASNTGIDNIREVLENAQYAPTAGRYKVYIIDEVHMLSKSAFNAMLKTLEEPPAHVKFILATTDPQKVPVTVLSRCLQFNLKQIPPQTVAQHLQFVLQQEQIPFEADALMQLGHAAQGSMRDALSLLDQAIAYGLGEVKADAVRGMLGTVDQSYLLRILDALAAGQGEVLLNEAAQMAARSVSFDHALQVLAQLLQQLAVLQAVPQALDTSTPDYSRLSTLADRFSPADVQLYYQIAVLGRRDLGLAPDEYAGFTMCLLRMLAFEPSGQMPPRSPRLESPQGADSHEVMPSSTPAAVAATPTVPPQAAAEVMPAVPVAAEAVQAATSVQRPPWEAELPPVEAYDEAPVSVPEPEAVVTPAPPVVVAPANVAALPDWHEVVQALPITGVAAMLAKHCVLTGVEDGVWSLTLPATYQSMLMQQDKLREALASYTGSAVSLRIQLGASDTLAPIQLEQQARAEALQQATEALLADPVVQYLQTHAGARLLTDTVQPLAPSA
ncbi:DNA polymerase III subunit gamma/tau [Leeia sp.]|uniref:DNA polymerase III subunit gamma/tau n=1 Tax=Leeia sp. TaxID=2884678 RepID=UPI0035B23560